MPVDARLNAIRRDLADAALAGRVFAQHYAIPVVRTAGMRTPVMLAPDRDAAIVGILEAGEDFEVLDLGREWAWGRCAGPGCVGYVACAALAHA